MERGGKQAEATIQLAFPWGEAAASKNHRDGLKSSDGQMYSTYILKPVPHSSQHAGGAAVNSTRPLTRQQFSQDIVRSGKAFTGKLAQKDFSTG